MRFASRAATRFALPGRTFCSRSATGTPYANAASSVGPEPYPPSPITTSGRKMRSAVAADRTASAIFKAKARLESFGAGSTEWAIA